MNMKKIFTVLLLTLSFSILLPSLFSFAEEPPLNYRPVFSGITSNSDTTSSTSTNGTTSLTLNATRYSTTYDGNLQLWCSGNQPSGTTYTWATNPKSVATISEDGLLQFRSIGKVDVTVTASTGDEATKTFYGVLPNGIYKLQNSSTKLYATLANGQIIEDVNMIQYGDQSLTRTQLWRIHYLGEGKYSIRSMVNPALTIALHTQGTPQRTVKAYNLGTNDETLPERAKWYFRGTPYSSFIESTPNDSTYRLAAPVGNTTNGSSVYAITTAGAGETSWSLIPITSDIEGADLYSGSSKVNNATSSMNVGETKQLTAVYYTAEEDISQNFTWLSSAPTVATVDSTGKITAHSDGTAIITATHNSGYNASVTINVYSNNFKLTIVAGEPYENNSITGHAFLILENNTRYSVTVGHWTLHSREVMTIGKWNNLDAAAEHAGVWYNMDSYAYHIDNKYHINVAYEIIITETDVATISNLIVEDSDEYDLITDNCVHFARKLWNAVASSSYQFTASLYTPGQMVRDISNFTNYQGNIVVPQIENYGYYNGNNLETFTWEE